MNKNEKNKILKRRIRMRCGIVQVVICFVALFFLDLPVRAVVNSPTGWGGLLSLQQGYLVKGVVRDSKGAPLPGVNVRLDGTITGTATNADGGFSLRLPEQKGVLSFSCIGFKTVKVPFTAGIPLAVPMVEDVAELDEVTIVAYGKQNRREVSGAVTVVKSEQMQGVTNSNLSVGLQGLVPGMNVMRETGSPDGKDVSIIIRGCNDLSIGGKRNPLFVIDGVPAEDLAEGNVLTDYNSADIESVTVLKDAASAAIYGSRAANGVILITTKQGLYGQQAQVTANVSHSIVFSPRLPDLTGGVLERRTRMEALRNYQRAYLDQEQNAYRYADSYEESFNNSADYDYFWNRGEGADLSIYQDSLNRFYNNSTNLFDYYFRTAHATDANLQVNGGTSGIAYNIGLGYYDEKGVLLGTGFNRLSLLTNLSFKPLRNTEGHVRINLSRTSKERSDKGMDLFNIGTGKDLSTIPPELLSTSTLLPGPGTQAFEELVKRYRRTIEKNEFYRLRASFDLSYEFIEGLVLKVSAAGDFGQQRQNIFRPAELAPEGNTYSSGRRQDKLSVYQDNLLTYSKVIAEKHSVDALLGFSVEAEESNDIAGYGKGAPSDLIHYVSWQGSVYDTDNMRALKDFSTDFEKSTMTGVFGRLNYNYNRKYYAGLTVRRDASSRFGENVRWGWFPSYFAAWDFTREKFMQWASGVLDYGKLRFSHGKSGRIFEFPYVAFGELEPGSPFLGNPTIQSQWSDGLINRDLTWEETRQTDLGADLELFNNRLGITADYYYRYTDKMLYNVPLPGSHSGYLRQWQNAYAISNEGIELMVKASLFRTESFKWNLSVNIAKNWNRLEKSSNKIDFRNADSRFLNNLSIIGKPLNGIYVFKDKGIYDSQDEVPYMFEDGRKVYLAGDNNVFYRPGDRVFFDADGNGKIQSNISLAEDRIYVGSPMPTVQGGMVTDLQWKGFDLNLQFNFAGGRHILNTGKGASVGTNIGITTADIARPIFEKPDHLDFWEHPGDDARYPANRIVPGLSNFATNLASNVEKVHYIKLKTMTIGYTLPESVRKRTGLNARIFVSGENLFTVTNYSGADPEAVNIRTGVDKLDVYPLSRNFTIGLTINFSKK